MFLARPGHLGWEAGSGVECRDGRVEAEACHLEATAVVHQVPPCPGHSRFGIALGAGPAAGRERRAHRHPLRATLGVGAGLRVPGQQGWAVVVGSQARPADPATACGQLSAPLNGQPAWLPGLSHEPHGLAGMRMASDESLGLAGTDSSLFRSCEWHCGHSGTVLDLTSASNSWPQPLQAYS